MPENLDYKSAKYIKKAPEWQKMRDIVEGERTIKSKGTLYVSKLSKQSESEYQAYINRGSFFNATGRTLAGLLGAIFRKAPAIAYPKPDDLKGVTIGQKNIDQFAVDIVNEVLLVGRCGVLIEPSADRQARFGLYVTESITIDRAEKVMSGEEAPTLIVLQETKLDYTKDRYKPEQVTQYRVLSLVNSIYFQQVYVKDPNKSDNFLLISGCIPEINGQPMKFIPFYFFDIKKLLLLGLADVNLAHWRVNVDYHHALHFTALPTPWATGVPQTAEFMIGSCTAWMSTKADSKFGMLEFTGEGLGALEKALASKENQMAILGARILEAPKAAVEAAQTHGIRKSTEDSILAGVANSVSAGITNLLRAKYAMDYYAEDPDINYQLNLDYTVARLDSTALTALVAAWQAGAVSFDTVIYNLMRGEIVPGNRTVEEEKRLIANSMHLLNVQEADAE